MKRKNKNTHDKSSSGTNVGFCTVPDLETGKKIAHYLVGKKLAACVNITSPITSIYRWKGEIFEEKEFLLIIKTKSKDIEHIITQIKSLHPYEVPEIIFLPIETGYPPYLRWILENVE